MYRPHGKAVLTVSVKKLFKNIEKPLDKRHKMCYNEYVKRTEGTEHNSYGLAEVFAKSHKKK